MRAGGVCCCLPFSANVSNCRSRKDGESSTSMINAGETPLQDGVVRRTSDQQSRVVAHLLDDFGHHVTFRDLFLGQVSSDSAIAFCLNFLLAGQGTDPDRDIDRDLLRLSGRLCNPLAVALSSVTTCPRIKKLVCRAAFVRELIQKGSGDPQNLLGVSPRSVERFGTPHTA